MRFKVVSTRHPFWIENLMLKTSKGLIWAQKEINSTLMREKCKNKFPNCFVDTRHSHFAFSCVLIRRHSINLECVTQ